MPLTSDHRAGGAGSGWSPERMITQLAGDRDLARQLAVIFVDECPRLLSAVRDSIELGSADGVRRAAHALKGSVLNFVDEGPAAEARELERMGREDRLDDAGATFARLERELALLLVHLRSFGAGTDANPERG